MPETFHTCFFHHIFKVIQCILSPLLSIFYTRVNICGEKKKPHLIHCFILQIKSLKKIRLVGIEVLS